MNPIEIAILPITGLILPYENAFSHFIGATLLDQFTQDFQHAFANPTISEIILQIDSPGGVVTGVHECAEMIYQARGKKPITAYISGMGASAAYWLASSADEIVLDATASVGSIGVLSIHLDDKVRKAQQGISEIQIVSSQSPKKRLDPATEEGKVDVQNQVDAIAQVFVEKVARNRHVSIETVLTDFGQGSLCVGIHAVKQGLADRMSTLAELIQEKSSTKFIQSSPTPFFHQPNHEVTMTETNIITNASSINTPPSITADYLMTHHPDLVKRFKLEGEQEERERIQAVENQLIPGHEVLIQTLKFDGKTSGVEAAVQVLAAEKQCCSQKLINLQGNTMLPLPIAMNITEEMSTTYSLKEKNALSSIEKWQMQWEKDVALQQEFGSFETYTAYMKAETKG